MSSSREKDPAAVALGRKGGAKGGPARAASMTAGQRSSCAKKAAKARWRKPVPGGFEEAAIANSVYTDLWQAEMLMRSKHINDFEFDAVMEIAGMASAKAYKAGYRPDRKWLARRLLELGIEA